MIGINVFSVVDLLAAIISTQVLCVFLYRSIRITKRPIDRLFTVVMLIVWIQSMLVLVSDNIVPAGVPAESVPNAAARTLLLYRLMYVTGTFLMATLTHFALRFAQSPHLAGGRAAWLYVGAVALIPFYFTDWFLVARPSPLQATSGWLCAVPWQPDAGPLIAVFVLLWLASNIYLQWQFRMRARAVVPERRFDQHRYVWCGATAWGVGGLVSLVLAGLGYAGVDPAMFLVAAAMVVLAVGLAEDHRFAETRGAFIKQVFGRYVADDVAEKLLASPKALELGGERRVVSVMMSDLRGFTSIAERLSPEHVVELLNIYLGAMSDVITRHRGTINEFIGDGILCIFGAPLAREDFVEDAVRCALAMQLAMADVNARLAHLGVKLEMGIGINTGDVIVGNIGSAKRAKYGVIGSNVNLAARIEAATVGGQVLVSASTRAALAGLLEVRREITLHPKGATQPVTVYDVVGLAGARPLRLVESTEQWTRIGDPVWVECTLVSEEKQIVGEPFAARLVSISPSSAQLESNHRLTVTANLRIRPAARVAPGPGLDVYGKVVACGPAASECTVRLTSTSQQASDMLRQLTGA